MKVFISYANEDKYKAEELSLALRGKGFEVFFDSERIQGGQDYNSIIHTDIQNSDLMVFLISPASLKKGAYPRTELKFAKEKWHHPKGHLLPVLSKPVDRKSIPPYLKAVSIIEPEGDLVPEVLAVIDKWDMATSLTQHRTTIRPENAAMLLGYELASLFGVSWSIVILRHFPPPGTTEDGNTWWSNVVSKVDEFAAVMDVEISEIRTDPSPISIRWPDEPIRQFRARAVEAEFDRYYEIVHGELTDIKRQLSVTMRSMEVALRFGFGLGCVHLFFPTLMGWELAIVPDKERMGIATYAKKLLHGRKTCAELKKRLELVMPDATALGIDRRLHKPFSVALNDGWKAARDVYCTYSWTVHSPAMLDLMQIKVETEFSWRRSFDALIIELAGDNSAA